MDKTSFGLYPRLFQGSLSPGILYLAVPVSILLGGYPDEVFSADIETWDTSDLYFDSFGMFLFFED